MLLYFKDEAEFIASLQTINRDHGVTIEVPDAAISPRLSMVGRTVYFCGKSVELTTVQAVIVGAVIDGPMTFSDVLEVVYCTSDTADRSDRTLQNHIYKINTKFLEAGIPFSISTAGSVIRLVSE